MEKNEMQQIQEAIQLSFTKIWEDNIEPAFNELNNKVSSLEDKVSQLPTKSYLDDKLADLEGGLITKLRKEDQKMNRLVDMLKQKEVLNDSDLKELKNLQIFPY